MKKQRLDFTILKIMEVAKLTHKNVMKHVEKDFIVHKKTLSMQMQSKAQILIFFIIEIV